ncbi:MFS transporter [Teredinibacter waterburyi]|uniref:MFS transporter n=1 Tax=Teredinibacter waterburyi TaxID=1500538 RepID=UPI00165F0A3F|nr:MFS transporter [Teredinibacter waterburyi]
MSPNPHRLPFYEKVGYSLGDAAANFVWRGALAYLAIFYTDTFGLTAAHAALLILLVRLSDGITDIIMGMVADRTDTRWGKFRPWVLWSAPALGLFMVLCFSTPDMSYTNKLIYAYITYIGLTLAYTVNNVPYSALMGVMTPSVNERAVLSGYRFAGAFGGGLLVSGFTLTLVKYFGQGNDQAGYQYTMYLFAALLVIFCMITYYTTKERVKPPAMQEGSLKQDLKDLSVNLPAILLPLLSITVFFYYREWKSGLFFVCGMTVTYLAIRWLLKRPAEALSNTQRDLVDLITNKPWVVLLAVGFLFMMFNGIRYGVIAYYFKYYAQNELMTQMFFMALLVVSMFTAAVTGYITEFISKKNLFILSMLLGAGFNSVIYFLGPDQITLVFVFGCIGEIFAAIMPVLFFSMLGDAADYSEYKNHRRATGLIYSAGTFINKTGGGFAGALVLIVLAGFGYNSADEQTIAGSLEGIKLLMSFIPAGFALLGMAVLTIYPLDAKRMQVIETELQRRRAVEAS